MTALPVNERDRRIAVELQQLRATVGRIRPIRLPAASRHARYSRARRLRLCAPAPTIRSAAVLRARAVSRVVAAMTWREQTREELRIRADVTPHELRKALAALVASGRVSQVRRNVSRTGAAYLYCWAAAQRKAG